MEASEEGVAGCIETGVGPTGLEFSTGGAGIGESVALPELVESALEGSELATPV